MIFFFFERIIMLCVYIEKSLKLNCCWWENSLLDDDDDVMEEEEEKEEVEKSERKKPFLRFIGFEKHSTIFHVLSFLSLALMLILCWWWHTPMMTIERRWKINVYSKLINDFFLIPHVFAFRYVQFILLCVWTWHFRIIMVMMVCIEREYTICKKW